MTFRIIGHRGDGAGPDENTPASCQRAVAAGADAIELDLRVNEHDDLVTGHNPGDDGESFADVLKELHIPLWLHIKEAPWRFRHRFRFDPEYYKRTIDLALPLVTGRDVMILSFAPGALRYVKQQAPRIPTIQATLAPSRSIRKAVNRGTDRVAAYPRSITKSTGKLATASNIPLVTINKRYSERAARRYAACGVSNIITDDVSGWVRAVSQARKP